MPTMGAVFHTRTFTGGWLCLTDESLVAKPDLKPKQFLLVPISPREALRRLVVWFRGKMSHPNKSETSDHKGLEDKRTSRREGKKNPPLHNNFLLFVQTHAGVGCDRCSDVTAPSLTATQQEVGRETLRPGKTGPSSFPTNTESPKQQGRRHNTWISASSPSSAGFVWKCYHGELDMTSHGGNTREKGGGAYLLTTRVRVLWEPFTRQMASCR